MPLRPSGVGRFTGRSAAAFVMLLLIGLLIAALLAVAAGPVRAFDQWVATSVNAVVTPHPVLVGVLTAVTALGSTWTAAATLSTVAVALLIRHRWRLAAYVAVTALGGVGLSPAIKELVGRLRPVVPQPVLLAPGPSFPSGHATTITITVGVLILVALPALSARAGRAAVAGGVLTVLLVGCTRIALGVHFVSDVAAGWVLGAAWVALTATAFRGWRHASGPADTSPARGLEPEAGPDLAPAPEHESPPAPGVRAAQLLVTAAMLLGMLLGVGWLVRAEEPGEPVADADLGAVRWLAEHRVGALDAVSAGAAELGNTEVVFAIGLVAATLALARLRRWWPVLLLVVALVGQLSLFLTTAIIVDRPRPQVSHLDAELPPTSSFPSGHTSAAICLYGGVAAIIFVSTRAWWRWLVVAAGVAVAITVALARLYRGAHFPTDVLASIMFAVPWLLMTLRVVRPRDPDAGAPSTAARARQAARASSGAAASPVRGTRP
jgi:undecaprenyl-diphosphatase